MIILGLVTLVLGMIVMPCHAQLQWNTWVFGQGAGIRFDSNGAKSVPEHFSITSAEGCASISDPKSGRLLFYTDGVNVWNAQHQVMGRTFQSDTAGLGGNETSTQSAAIVAVPGSDSLYYIFSIGPADYNLEYDPSLYYSIVDIDGRDGRGRVLAERVRLIYGVSERVVIARGADSCTFWVIAASDGEDWFGVWKLTSTGLSDPTIIHAGGMSEMLGYLRLSPSGRILALASFKSSPSLQLFEFDPHNGSIRFLADSDLPRAYGVEFSPDEHYLYVSHMWSPDQGAVSVVSQIPVASILSGEWRSKMTIVDTGQSRHYALQRGPDNRIYVVGPEANYLDVIDSPNVAGVGCAYRARGVYLGSNASTVRGLPNTISNDRPAELCPMRVDDASAFGLRGVFSNTVLSETRIRFWTALPGRVRIDIQDMLGRSRAVVLDQYMINTAEQEIYLDDQELESGVFIVRLIYEGNAVSQPFVLVR